MIRCLCFTFLILVLLSSCNQEDGGKSILTIQKKEDFAPKEVVNAESTTNRSTWQKPDLVLSLLGDLKGKVIADIGAGTGYFTYRMASKGAKVVAVDVDRDMISLMNGFKENLPKEISSLVSPRLVPFDNPGLNPEEVDMAIIINTIGYIKNKSDYLRILRKGIKSDGRLMIIDYKDQELDIPAPPMSERIAIGQLQKHLEKAGYTNIDVNDGSLEYQYIITADK